MSYLDDLVRDIAVIDRPGDQRVAILARKQHGVVARWQLLALGFSRDQIQDRTKTGRLHPLHRAVYAVGHRSLTRKSRWMAAVLACGRGALLSHKPATGLWDLRPAGISGPIDVTVPGRTRKGHPGVRVHNVRTLDEEDRAVNDGIPVTAVHRTLLDYAEVARYQQLRHAVDAAERRELLDGRELERLHSRSPGRRGLRPLTAAIAEIRGPAAWTRSELERVMLALIRDAGLPEPSANVMIEGFLVDLVWPRERVVVELDGYEFHKSRRQFEEDRLRDAKLQLAGYRVLRVTQSRLADRPREVLRDLICLLGAACAA